MTVIQHIIPCPILKQSHSSFTTTMILQNPISNVKIFKLLHRVHYIKTSTDTVWERIQRMVTVLVMWAFFLSSSKILL